MTYHPKFIELVADTFLLTDLSLNKVANMYGVSQRSVRVWALKKEPHLFNIAKGRNRQLLQALDVLEAQPNIRAEELSQLVGVSRFCIENWNKKGKIQLDIQCEICGESTTTKYCPACVEKGWHVYFNRMLISLDELSNMPKACEVCGSEDRLHVDHNHNTNKYRGVLCHHCNVALGMVMDNITTLEKLIEYLQTKNI